VVADCWPVHGHLALRPFDVTGTGALRKLEHEIWAIGS
jgi:hypothetical protein